MQLTVWHHLIAAMAFALFGVIFHILRGVVDTVQDRHINLDPFEIVVARAKPVAGRLLAAEYDDQGCYRLDSVKNLKLTVGVSIALGMGLVLFGEAAGIEAAGTINKAVIWMGERALSQLESIGLV